MKKNILILALVSSVYFFAYGATVRSASGNIFMQPDTSSSDKHSFDSNGLNIGTTTSLTGTSLNVQGNVHIDSGSLVLGQTDGLSSLSIHGSFGFTPSSISSNTTLGSSSTVFADTSGGNLYLDLSYAGNSPGRMYTIKKTQTQNELIINGGGNMIDQYFGITLSSGNRGTLKVVSDGTRWRILNLTETLVPSANLIGWWSLDDTAGTSATDSSKYDNSGTVVGTNFGASSVSGNLDRGMDFDGSDDQIQIGNSNFASKTGTISAWARADDTTPSNQVYIFGRNASGENDGEIYMYLSSTDDKVTFVIQDDSGSSFCDADSALGDTGWHHYAGVWDENGVYIYVDGVLQADTETARELFSYSNGFAIGRIHGSGTGGSSYWDGAIDDLRIYNVALSPGQIYELFLMGQ